MTQSDINRMFKLPPDEYGEYYKGYIHHIEYSELDTQLSANLKTAIDLLDSIDEEKALYRYEEGKWSVKEVFGHIIDTERIFTYRALAIARGEENPLAGYDHNQYVNAAGFDDFELVKLSEQYQTTRAATLSLFQSFTQNELLKRGVVNGSNFTVRGLGFVIAGHELHHFQILRDRYLDL